MDYAQIGQDIGIMVGEKQAAYGNSFGKVGQVLRILYPHGVQSEQYDDMLCVVRILDKLFRIATDKAALGESPYKDIAGYGILGSALLAPCVVSRDVNPDDLSNPFPGKVDVLTKKQFDGRFKSLSDQKFAEAHGYKGAPDA